MRSGNPHRVQVQEVTKLRWNGAGQLIVLKIKELKTREAAKLRWNGAGQLVFVKD